MQCLYNSYNFESMSSVQSGYSENLMLDCLNRLENIKNKLRLSCSSPQLAVEVSVAISDVKMYLQTIKINKEVFSDMQEEIRKLQREKDSVVSKHRMVLENLEMLIYQKDYQDLKVRLNEYKADNFDQSLSPFTPRMEKTSSSDRSRLDRAFVIQDSQSSDNQFLSDIKNNSEGSSRVRKALDIINSASPFEKKEEVWLDIMYSKNIDEAQLNHVTQKEVLEVKRHQKEITEFQISQSEENEPLITRQTELHFSGKKIKSMILLKQKSSKKKSKMKTSVKKAVQARSKEKQNAQHETSKLRKKLQFTGRLQESSEKECRQKNARQSEIKAVKSFRKTLINNY